VPAEWLRFAFHDMATHNIDDGSGGLDGSIVYELGRPENFGLGFNQTLSDFEAFPNKLISRADVIAIGTVMAVATCGGPVIPFRGGRIDTWTPGGTGTPEPQHDISTLTESFKKQGFNQAEMIKLVACGHTMGGVRSADFPQLVAPNPNSVNPVIDDFDTTMNFDNKVVTEYIDGSTQNVLVVGSNQTLLSDLRVFASDGNSTVKSIADKNSFQSECQTMLARMIDTVPRGVTLTDEITLLPAKVTAAQLTFEKDKLVFKTSFRLTQPGSATVNANRVVTLFWCDRYGTNKDCSGKTSSSSPITKPKDDPNFSPIMATLNTGFITYNFIVPIDSTASISQFWFQVDEKDGSKPTVYKNGDTSKGGSPSSGSGYILDQDQVLFVPMLSHMNVVSNGNTSASGESFTRKYSLVAAVRQDLSPSRVYVDATDVATKDFTTPINTSVDLALNSTFPSAGGYQFYSGNVDDVGGVQLTLDVHAVAGGQTYTQTFMQTSTLDNTLYVAPGNVTTTTTKGSSAAIALSVPTTKAMVALAGVAGGLLMAFAL